MKKLSYLLMTAMAAFLIGCTNEQNSPVEEQENEELQTLVFNAEIDTEEAPNSNASLRIAYEDGVAGLRPVWAVGDVIEFFMINRKNQKQAVVGKVKSVNSENPNKAKIEVSMRKFGKGAAVTYYAVTGSGKAGEYGNGGTISTPAYFQGGGTWYNYHLIKTNHIVNNMVVDKVNDNTDVNYDTNLKPSIIQVASGTFDKKKVNYLQFRNIGSLFAVTIKNTSNTELKIYRLTFKTKSSNTQWVYALNNADNRFDPATFDMTPGSVKAGSYVIFDVMNQDKPTFNIPANSEKTIYQWFVPVKGASVSDLQLEVVPEVQGNVIKTIDLSGNKTFAPARRVKISRTWNGTEFVK